MRFRVFILLTILSISNLSAQPFTEFVRRLEILLLEKRAVAVEKFFSENRITPIVEQDSLLHFVFYGKTGSVGVNGNLQHWNVPDELIKIECGDSSFFYRTFVVPSNARLDYQMIVDGNYQLDPRNPHHTPSGFGNRSEVRMPKFVSSPYLKFRNDISHGTIDSLRPVMNIPAILSRYLSSIRRYRPPEYDTLSNLAVAIRPIKIYRPPGYDTLSNLASVYIHDGFEAIDFARVPTIIDNLIAEKKIPPIIAVFIHAVERHDEYVGNKRDQYVKYLSDDLVPLIDRLYKTNRLSFKRAMMGISAGGHISLYAALSRPDIFQNVGAQSSGITPWLTELTKKQSDANRISPQLKIYIDCGRYDIKIVENPMLGNVEFLEMNRRYSSLLSSLHIPHYYKEVNDGHAWENWRERMPEMLIYFFGR